MRFSGAFNACAVDYYGYVAPRDLMREINEGVAVGNYYDGTGFETIYPAIGATWMLGQCVLEYFQPIYAGEAFEVESGAREHFGATIVRRCSMYQYDKEVARFSTKLLPVYFESRRVVPSNVLADFWKRPAIPCGEPIEFIELPENMELAEVYCVSYRDCDSNRHMTAFRYLDLTLESIGYWEGPMRLAERVQIDYKRECLYGDVLHLNRGEKDGILYCSGVKSDGTVAFNSSVKLSKEAYKFASETRDYSTLRV